MVQQQTPPTEVVQTPTPEPTPQTPPAPAPTGDRGASNMDEVRMTRAELDRQVNEAAAAARRSAEAEVKSSQEVKDLRAKAKRLEEIEDAQKTEAERLVAERDREKQRADTADVQRRDALIRAEFAMVAPEKGIPADRLKAALRLLDLDEVSITDEGEVKGMPKALDALIQANPFLTAHAGGTGTPVYGGGGVRGTPSREAQIQQAQQELRRSGAYARL